VLLMPPALACLTVSVRRFLMCADRSRQGEVPFCPAKRPPIRPPAVGESDDQERFERSNGNHQPEHPARRIARFRLDDCGRCDRRRHDSRRVPRRGGRRGLDNDHACSTASRRRNRDPLAETAPRARRLRTPCASHRCPTNRRRRDWVPTSHRRRGSRSFRRCRLLAGLLCWSFGGHDDGHDPPAGVRRGRHRARCLRGGRIGRWLGEDANRHDEQHRQAQRKCSAQSHQRHDPRSARFPPRTRLQVENCKLSGPPPSR
jgi:hypothetical protein